MAAGVDAAATLILAAGTVTAGAEAAPRLGSAAGAVVGAYDAPCLDTGGAVVVATAVGNARCAPAAVDATALCRRAVGAAAALRGCFPPDATLVETNAIAAPPPDVLVPFVMTALAASSAYRIASRLSAAADAAAADCATFNLFA